jgi:integration host factor subunit alpha
MTLTKSEMIEKISTKTGLSRKIAAETIGTILDIVKDALESGEDVAATGFGKFSVHDKSERKGRNPATGEEILLPARKTVKFKCSEKLRGIINNQNENE